MPRPITAAALCLLVTIAGCDAGECPDVSGAWHATAHCSSDSLGASYQITQTGCELAVDEGGVSLDGRVWHDGTVSLYGTTGGGVMGCSGASDDERISLVCEPDTSGCIVELARGAGSVIDDGVDTPPPAPDCADIEGDWSRTYCDGDAEEEYVGQEGCDIWMWDVLGAWKGTIDSDDHVSLSIEWSWGDETHTTSCSATLETKTKYPTGGGATVGYTSQHLDFDCSSNLCTDPPHQMQLVRSLGGD